MRTAAPRPHVARHTRPLRGAVRLVLRADADPDRAGRRDRVHDADLDRDPRRRLPRRAPRRARALAVALGLVGVAVIVRPGLDHVDPGQLIALAAAVGFAIAFILVKSLTATESRSRSSSGCWSCSRSIGLVPAVLAWRTPTAAVWPWIGVIALCGTYSHYCMTQALRHAEATVIVPMDFLRVPLTAAAGWLVYAERLDLYTVARRRRSSSPPTSSTCAAPPRPPTRLAWRRRHERDPAVSHRRRSPRRARRAGAGCRRRTPGSTTRCCSRSASSSSARSAG